MEDPEPGTDCNGAYEVICQACGGWIELHRFARVTFRATNASVTVPPRVFHGLAPLPETSRPPPRSAPKTELDIEEEDTDPGVH